MIIELLKPIQANGEVIPEGTIIRIESIEVSKRMIQEGIGRAVDLVMDEVLKETIYNINTGQRWKVTPEVRRIEALIDQTYLEVIAGSKTIEDFKDVCRIWKIAGTNPDEIP